MLIFQGVFGNCWFFMYAIGLIMIMRGNPPFTTKKGLKTHSLSWSGEFQKMNLSSWGMSSQPSPRCLERCWFFSVVLNVGYVSSLECTPGIYIMPFQRNRSSSSHTWLRIAAASCWTVCFPLPCKKWWFEISFLGLPFWVTLVDRDDVTARFVS